MFKKTHKNKLLKNIFKNFILNYNKKHCVILHLQTLFSYKVFNFTTFTRLKQLLLFASKEFVCIWQRSLVAYSGGGWVTDVLFVSGWFTSAASESEVVCVCVCVFTMDWHFAVCWVHWKRLQYSLQAYSHTYTHFGGVITLTECALSSPTTTITNTSTLLWLLLIASIAHHRLPLSITHSSSLWWIPFSFSHTHKGFDPIWCSGGSVRFTKK